MKRIARNKLLSCFIVVELVLYIAFIILDVYGVYSMSSIIKFTTILLCLVMSIVIQLLYEHFLDRVMLSIALSFTVLADIFLLFTEYYVIGVCCFCVVQTFYLARIVNMKEQVGRINRRVHSRNLYRGDGRVRFRNLYRRDGIVPSRFLHRKIGSLFLEHFIARVMISGIILVVLLVIKFPIDALFVITIFYLTSFICNIIMVFQMRARAHYFQDDIRLGLFLAGLVLFFCCDIMVGIFNATGYVHLSDDIYQTLYQVSSIGMWVFYLPGQILITLS